MLSSLLAAPQLRPSSKAIAERYPSRDDNVTLDSKVLPRRLGIAKLARRLGMLANSTLLDEHCKSIFGILLQKCLVCKLNHQA